MSCIPAVCGEVLHHNRMDGVKNTMMATIQAPQLSVAAELAAIKLNTAAPLTLTRWHVMNLTCGCDMIQESGAHVMQMHLLNKEESICEQFCVSLEVELDEPQKQ